MIKDLFIREDGDFEILADCVAEAFFKGREDELKIQIVSRVIVDLYYTLQKGLLGYV